MLGNLLSTLLGQRSRTKMSDFQLQLHVRIMWELLKVLMPRPYPRQLKSECLGGIQASVVFTAPHVILMSSQGSFRTISLEHHESFTNWIHSKRNHSHALSSFFPFTVISKESCMPSRIGFSSRSRWLVNFT